MRILSDQFDRNRPRGKVIGRSGAPGAERYGVDVEKVMSIDNGALRIQPLRKSGWQRACISYGPFDSLPGLALSVFMLNGHNTSQAERIPETFRARLLYWLYGSRSFGGRLERIKRLVMAGGRIRRVFGQFRQWRRLTGREIPPLDENLAVGWFSQPVANPETEGSAFVMHATGHECGELWIRAREQLAAVVGSVQNLQIYYVSIVREDSVIYYASSIPNANSLTAYPCLRPLGIDTVGLPEEVWASVHQSVLGQMGFRLDTRIYGVGIAREEAWQAWHGGAHCADSLRGAGELEGTRLEYGGEWVNRTGQLSRTGDGATTGSAGTVTTDPSAPTGLLRCLIRFDDRFQGVAALRWRGTGSDSYWSLECTPSRVRLLVTVHGVEEILVTREQLCSEAAEFQILDDGDTLGFYLNGALLFDHFVRDSRLSDGSEIGISLTRSEGEALVSDFEAHPRSIPLPRDLDLGSPWYRLGTKEVVRDDFQGAPGDLAASVTTTGNKAWRRLHGRGEFRRDGKGAVHVCATQANPCPGRTMYGIEWDDPEFADVSITITPPGTARGQKENGISGIVIWQDEDNYLTVNSWVCDGYDGASISCFFNIRGWEDVYDAIWSNVGARIVHGKAYTMRVVADPYQYMVLVNDEPVVYRAFRDVYADCGPLAINAVGLITNWEWGLDTGSIFRDFRGRV